MGVKRLGSDESGDPSWMDDILARMYLYQHADDLWYISVTFLNDHERISFRSMTYPLIFAVTNYHNLLIWFSTQKGMRRDQKLSTGITLHSQTEGYISIVLNHKRAHHFPLVPPPIDLASLGDDLKSNLLYCSGIEWAENEDDGPVDDSIGDRVFNPI